MDNNNLKLSIIVPVYNVEKYLRVCLNSLINQDLASDEYEIIIVNDGSTDSSLLICKEYANKYSNIFLYSQSNQGLSCARNTGLLHAKGEYIQFVDSDDYIEENVLNKLYTSASAQSADIFFYAFFMDFEDRDSIFRKSFDDIPSNEIFSGEKFVLKITDFGGVWKAFYRRNFIFTYDIFFTPKISREDCDFNLRLFPLATRISMTDSIAYHYRILKESMSHTKNVNKLKHNLFSEFVVISNVRDFINRQNLSRQVKCKYRKFLNSMLVASCLNLIKCQHIYGKVFVENTLKYGYEKELLPIRGKTNSWKTTLSIPIINTLAYLRASK